MKNLCFVSSSRLKNSPRIVLYKYLEDHLVRERSTRTNVCERAADVIHRARVSNLCGKKIGLSERLLCTFVTLSVRYSLPANQKINVDMHVAETFVLSAHSPHSVGPTPYY